MTWLWVICSFFLEGFALLLSKYERFGQKMCCFHHVFERIAISLFRSQSRAIRTENQKANSQPCIFVKNRAIDYTSERFFLFFLVFDLRLVIFIWFIYLLDILSYQTAMNGLWCINSIMLCQPRSLIILNWL